MYNYTMKTGFLLILTGSSASGKNTISKKILAKYPNFSKVITTTTRTPRPGETNGVDYYFTDPKKFKEMVKTGEIMEYAQYSGNFYGTSKSQIQQVLEGKDLIWIIEATMASKAKEFFPSYNTLVIYISLPENEAIRRLTTRGMNEEVIQQRLEQDRINWQNLKEKFEFVIANNDGHLDETVEKVIKLLPSGLVSQQ